MMLSLALSLALTAADVSEPIPPTQLVHLGFSLQLTHLEELATLRKAQLDPAAPEYRQWLTPQQFGQRFGQPEGVYGELQAWLEHAGLEVTTAPSRAFIEAWGTAQQIEQLLHIVFVPLPEERFSVHTFNGPMKLPARLAPLVVNVSGLDTRVRTRHHLDIGNNTRSLGPQDLRRFYGIQPLLDQGFVGQGQRTVVLSTALPPGSDVNPADVQYFYRSIADVSTPFRTHVAPNPQQDFDTQPGGASEFELDVEMHAVSLPGAESITLEVSPASEVFTTGANDIANNLSTATAVSISLGICEAGQLQNDMQLGTNEFQALRNAVIQGTMEGQTWSAATGDNGANDCRNGSLSVDFPSDIPEMIGAGGSMISTPAWNGSGALLAYGQETTWNGGNNGGAAGGGLSIVFQRPSYQDGLGFPDAGRVIPDIALIAGVPGVAVDSTTPGQLEPVQGTSVSSPLSAGMFALLASKVGCRQGDIHSILYALGNAQADGGAVVFHDITTGNLTNGGVTGPSAKAGYDSATGWGSINLAALAAAWPACPALPDGGVVDAGVAVAPYSACDVLGCDGGTTCTTLPNGPSSCVRSCNASNPASCPSGTVCSSNTLFASPPNGECIPGCLQDSDCMTPGTVCSVCTQTCVPRGLASAHVGDACQADSECPNGAFCVALSRTATVGYCTYDCDPTGGTAACGCPTGSVCGVSRFTTAGFCYASCPQIGAACSQDGYVCQPQDATSPACLPTCRVVVRQGQTIDTCSFSGSSLACDADSGVCGGIPPVTDAGVDGGVMAVDAGQPEIDLVAVPETLGAQMQGCGCSSPGMVPFGALLLLGWARRSRRS
jgi:hypothetical protein